MEVVGDGIKMEAKRLSWSLAELDNLVFHIIYCQKKGELMSRSSINTEIDEAV
jgi:hypothetical protein